MKTIEFIYTENETPLKSLKEVLKRLNVKYHHHYIKENNICVLEYFDK